MGPKSRPWQGSKPLVTSLVVGLAVLAIAIPIFVAIAVARAEGVDASKNEAMAFAHEALHRSQAEADQAASGVVALAALARTGDAPCSAPVRAEMRALELSSSDIQAFGAVENNVLICSSIGTGRMALGTPTTVTGLGAELYANVLFPGDSNMPYFVQVRNGFAAVVNKELPIDVETQRNVAVAEFAVPGGQIVAQKGFIEHRWIHRVLSQLPNPLRAPKGVAVTYREGDRFISVTTSSSRYLGTIAVLSAVDLNARARKAALVLVPVGTIAGLLLALAVLFLARMQLELPAVLRLAMKRRELFLEYQPIVDIETGAWVGAEALIRWQRENGELIRPDVFVPVAEEIGLARKLSEHVVELLTPDLTLIAALHPDFSLSINLTADDLSTTATISLIRELITASHVRPDCLTLEATERGFLNPEVSQSVIDGLHELGVGVAIDDFGTGYSSLSYLETLSVDVLKIDKSFVDTIGTGAATSTVVQHIIEIAMALGLKLVAEGVELESQASILRDRGVQRAQGFLWSKPISFHQLLDELARRSLTSSLTVVDPIS
jgi:sensor c-di-GMP phosphodiesterase-like protein